jgi:putative ABC transport system permease protein
VKLALIAFRNLARNRLRTVLTVAGAAVAILAFVSVRTVLSAWSAAADYAAKDRIATRHKVSLIIPLPKRYIEDIRAVPGVKQATFMSWFGGKNPRDPNKFFASIAVDTDSFLSVYDEISLSPEDQRRWREDRQGALVGDLLARQLGLKVGDRITLQGSIYPGDWEFDIAGVYTATRKSVDRSTLWFHWSYLDQSLPESRRDLFGWAATRIEDPGRGAEIAAAIDRIFDDKDAQTVTMSERAMNLSWLGMLSAILRAMDVVSLIILLIMMMLIGNTIAMGVRERTREYGVLQALGFRPAHIRGFIIGEALALGLVAGAAGLGLAFPLVEIGMRRWLEENMGSWFPSFRIAPATYVAALILAATLAVAAALPPALRAGRLSVTNALRRVA